MKVITPIDIEEKLNVIIYKNLIKRNSFLSALIQKFTSKEIKITPQSNFRNDLGADSLGMVLLIMEFEKEFNIRIEDEDAEKINTVSQAKECISKKIQQRIVSESEIIAYTPFRFFNEFIGKN